MKQLRARPEVCCRHLGEETVLFDSRTSTAHVINRTAAEVWELCDGSRTLDEVVAVMGERYPGAGGLEADIAELVCAFENQGLLAEAAPGAEGDGAPGPGIQPEGSEMA